MKKDIKGLEKYSDSWIAVDRDKSEVVYASKTYKDLLRKVEKISKNIFILKLPPRKGYLIP